MSDGGVKILDGNTFVVSDDRGDIEASPTDPSGLFSFDTRFLSRWVLTVDGERLSPLSIDDLQYYEARFFLVPGTGTVYVDAKLSVIRQRAVVGGFHEQLTILNHAERPVRLQVRLDADCDFADLFEVKDALRKKGRYTAEVTPRSLVLRYERGPFRRETTISSTARARYDPHGLSFDVRIPAHGEWTTELHVVAQPGASGRTTFAPGDPKRALERMRRNLDRWLDSAPRLESDDEQLKETYRRSLVDWPRSVSRRRSRAAAHFQPPACRGS